MIKGILMDLNVKIISKLQVCALLATLMENVIYAITYITCLMEIPVYVQVNA